MVEQWKTPRSASLLTALLCSLLSVAALLDSRPVCNIDFLVRSKSDACRDFRLRARSNKGNKEKGENGFLNNFFNEKEGEAESSTGFLNYISKWREGRKIGAETEQQRKEARKEAAESRGFLPNGLNITQLFRRSSSKDESPREGSRDTEIKLGTGRKRIEKVQGAPKADTSKIKNEPPLESGRIALEEDATTPSKRSNPLSVAQNFVSNVLSKQSSNEEWVAVASKTSMAPGALVPVSAAGLDLLLVASKDGSALHCIANSCPHLGTPLEIGTLERRPIEYPESDSDSAVEKSSNLQETYIAKLLAQDGCEDCIVCPLHRTAFALDSGEVRGEWCPYPPVVGKMVGAIKSRSNLAVFDVRTKGKNIEVRLNTPIVEVDNS
eukprot:scaffold3079_cov119-Cylindrotheca_fusiformis.AAC.18